MSAAKGDAMKVAMVRRYLIAEYCSGPFYMGWWLYLRESKHKQVRNRDGGWGWIRNPRKHASLVVVLRQLGIEIRGDGTMDGDGVREVARRWPIHGERVGRRPRGCIEVDVDEYGRVSLHNEQAERKT